MCARLAELASCRVACEMNWHRSHRVAVPRGLHGVVQSAHCLSLHDCGIGLIPIAVHELEQNLVGLPSSGLKMVVHLAHWRLASSGASSFV